MVAAYRHGSKELISPFEYKGYTDTPLFVHWIEEHLCPNLQKGECVIMDNFSGHKAPEVREAIEKAGCTLLYLPAYCPDLNPIEHCWANFKRNLRKIIKTFENFPSAITTAILETFPC